MMIVYGIHAMPADERKWMTAKHGHVGLALTTIVCLCAVFAGFARADAATLPSRTADTSGGAAFAPGGAQRYIVRFTTKTALNSTVAGEAKRGTPVTEVFGHALNGFVATMSADEVSRLESDPNVVGVERDSIVTAATDEINPPWGLDRIDQPALPFDHNYSYGSTGKGVTAYIVDSGIRTTHTDFAGRILPGWYADFHDGTGVEDCNGHGTHVAGIIGGTTYGVAKEVSLVPVKILPCSGATLVSTVVAGLDWIIANHHAGVPAVANMSIGGNASGSLDAAVNAVIADGVTVVVAAGNDATSSCQYSPARVPAAITVGATDSHDQVASYSNHGPCNDLFAPGSSILSAWDTSNTATATLSGTSMASPHVTGAVARILQTAPSSTPAEVAALLDSDVTTGVLHGTSADDPDKLLNLAPFAAPSPGPPDSVAGFATLGPVRLFDTRPDQAQGAVPVDQSRYGGTHVLAVKLAGVAGVPAWGVGAVSLNVTVIDPVGAGFVTVYPCGERPLTSSLNYTAGEVVPNAVIAPLSADGRICFYSSVDTDLIADINGWFTAGAGFAALPPTRVFDTRPDEPQGAVSVAKQQYGDLMVRVTGAAGVPVDGVSAVSLNVTAIHPVGAGFVTVYPCGERPLTSSLNYAAGQIIPNAVIAPVSADGEICIHSSSGANLVADINGWFATGAGFAPLPPARVFDTRPAEPQGAVTVVKQQYGFLQVKITGAGGVPLTNVDAVSLNVTVVDPVAAGFVTVYPCGDRPLTSSLNYTAGEIVPNAVLAPVSASGEVCFYSSADAHLVVDVNGWYASD